MGGVFRWLGAAVVVVLAGCGKSGAGVPELPANVVGHCSYTNKFSTWPECRDYLGAWTAEKAATDCKDSGGTVELGSACPQAELYGYCILGGDGSFTRIQAIGSDVSKCGSAKRGCELFGGGVFDPAPRCGGLPEESVGSGLPTFQQPTQVCVPPKAGEPAGQSEGGLVCTWQAISGATEEGRRFEDYASCDVVRTQRPYYPVPAEENAAREDAKLADPAFVTELSWVKRQVEATACVCCHSTRAPKGPSNWYVDQPGNFLNGFRDRGIAMAAGWINTASFGAYDPAVNNGFHRANPANPEESMFVTTDSARMKRFFLDEAARRGLKKEDFAGEKYPGGPLDAQLQYVPQACERGEGVDASGTVRWTGGPARYVYVLEAGSANPTVPPNLDLPTGTLWRIDVPWTGSPVSSGAVTYGTVPGGFVQKHPQQGAPERLISGKQYLLYVLQDIIIPVTRCTFTAP